MVLLPPEWLIVGLGNPGPEYRGTRHNVGFEVIDALATSHKIQVKTGRSRGIYGQGMIEGKSVCLFKPLTYMNLSGQAVSPLAKNLGIKPDHILVIADDIDLPVGKLRLRQRGGAGGHNGHRSMISSLGTEEYPRLKVGVGKGEFTIDHVLGSFHPEERVEINEAVRWATKCIEALITEGNQRALHVLEEAHRDR